MNIGIVGAGATGLSAAYYLSQKGHKVTVFEAENTIGGIASSVDAGKGRIEKFYHHIFTGDKDIINLISELDLGGKLKWYPPNNALYGGSRIYPFTTATDLLRYPEIPLNQRIKLGLLVLRSGFLKDWKALENISAEEWVRKYAGNSAYEKLWGPLLESKFDKDAGNISAAWLWNKLKLRGGSRGGIHPNAKAAGGGIHANAKAAGGISGGRELLGYMEGSFEVLYNKLREEIASSGGRVLTGHEVNAIMLAEGGRLQVSFSVSSLNSSMVFDKVIVTAAPEIFLNLAGGLLSDGYRRKLSAISYKANICVMLELREPVSPYYWITVSDKESPFVLLIEHTSLVSPEPYGCHIVYLSKYLDCSNPLFEGDDSSITGLFTGYLKKMFPGFSPEFIIKSRVYRARYAQPVVVKNYSDILPEYSTSVENLYLASMAQVYPEDRGQNCAIRAGRQIADIAGKNGERSGWRMKTMMPVSGQSALLKLSLMLVILLVLSVFLPGFSPGFSPGFLPMHVPRVFAVSENLIYNPSFEEGPGEGTGAIPYGWSTWQWDKSSGITEFRTEEGGAFSGERFVTIVSHGENDGRFRQVVSVEENASYRISCRILTKGVGTEKTGANISVEGLTVTSPDIRGSSGDWIETELYIQTGKGAENFILTLGLGGYGNINTGTASFDDVKMEKADAIPAGARVAYIGGESGSGASGGNTDGSGASGSGGRPFWLMGVAIIAGAAAYLHYTAGKGNRENPAGRTTSDAGKSGSRAGSSGTNTRIPGTEAGSPKTDAGSPKTDAGSPGGGRKDTGNRGTGTGNHGKDADGKSKKLSKIDCILMSVLTAVYLAVALVGLGSLSAPETGWNPSFPGEEFTVDFAGPVNLSRITYFCAGGTGWSASGTYRVEYRDGNGDYLPLTSLNKDNVFTWKYTDVSITTDSLRIIADSPGGAINEICFYESGSREPVKDFVLSYVNVSSGDKGAGHPENLFDEQSEHAWLPSYFNGTYFDEIYHARTAYEHINGIEPFENTHPPLGKLFIALGVLLFGMNPFGWRIMGVLFGAAMIPAMYMFGRKIFRSSFPAFCAAFLMAFDFMHFVQSRIATIDVYVTLFVILMFYFMYDYFMEKSYVKGFKNSLKPLFFSGLFFGLGVSTKWIALYGASGLAFLFFLAKHFEYKDYRRILKDKRKARRAAWVDDFVPLYVNKTFAACVVFFILIPVLFYALSYLPFLGLEGPGHGLRDVISLQKHMYNYHSGLKETHSFSSPWWQWPIMTRPMWFYKGPGLPSGRASSIVSFGNPAVWWTGIAAFFAAAVIAVKRRDSRMTVVICAILAQYLPWVLVPRIAFIYHYFSIVPFIILCIVYVIEYITEKAPDTKYSVYGYLALVLVLFVIFYPVLSGMEVDASYIRKLRWFDTWVF